MGNVSRSALVALGLDCVVAEVGDDVAVAFEDVHDLEDIGLVAEKDDVAAEGEAA